MKRILIYFLCAVFFSCNQQSSYQTWEVYGGNKENNHYSAASQIDTNNVHLLKPIWEYHCGDADSQAQIQVNPIIVGTTLYGVSPKLKLFALQATTGKKIWSFDPATYASKEPKGNGYFAMNVCRGVTFYKGKNKQYIFYAVGAKLYCIDARVGKPVLSFGEKGTIDLHTGLGENAKQLYVAATTPGVIYKDLLIIGSRVAEDAAAAPGYIRAFDVHSGKLRWVFHTIPKPGEEGFSSWEDTTAYQFIGGANAWAGFSLDEKRGIVFAPIGSASYDFYGGKRKGANLFANAVLALDAATGKHIWHFQTVHHDLWDRDLPTAPILTSIRREGVTQDVVVQPTKSGFVFVLDRATGKLVFDVIEKSVPTNSDLLGEYVSPTQPYPVLPEPFVRQYFTAKDVNQLIPTASKNIVEQQLAKLKPAHLYQPPSFAGTLIFPGFDGGAEWGGGAVDPYTQTLYINASEMPWILTMIPLRQTANETKETIKEAGIRLYTTNCMACHGVDKKGTTGIPSLVGLEQKYDVKSCMALIASGRRMMPAITQLNTEEREAVALYILGEQQKSKNIFKPQSSNNIVNKQVPYTSTGYKKFLSPEGLPAVDTPWGTLTAIDLNTGKKRWRKPLGVDERFSGKGIITGTENYGGPVVTAGGLVFIAATSDKKIRAFHKRTGQQVWEANLPACGFATPSVYTINGKQFLTIACGGGKLKQKTGDSYLTFAL